MDFYSADKKGAMEASVEGIDLADFRSAHNGMYHTALREIRAGKKINHWIWYIFPQLKILGRSYMAQRYGIKGAEQAKAFYNDETLGRNLKEICEALLECESDNAFEVMGPPDDLKLKSSMTLFYLATGDELFKKVLDKFYSGQMDEITVSYLENE